MRVATIPQKLSSHLESEWNKLSESEKNQCAKSVQELSQFFQTSGGPLTPWEEPRFLNAYLFYFFPLNLARAGMVLTSCPTEWMEGIENVVDMGSGLGNFSALQKSLSLFSKANVFHFERDTSALRSGEVLQQSLFDDVDFRRTKDFKDISSLGGSMAFFSYSWIEMKVPVAELSRFENLIFIEPSTQSSARSLMSLRQELIGQGFSVLAPCTHNLACPLLVHSHRDWCHDRVHFEKPNWYLDLESRLPMKNDTLTSSYLVMSKRAPSMGQGLTRVIGDTLKEKGKTRQAVCFDDQRRFLSWLKRDNADLKRIDHGSLIKINDPQYFGNEVRSKDIETDLDT